MSQEPDNNVTSEEAEESQFILPPPPSARFLLPALFLRPAAALAICQIHHLWGAAVGFMLLLFAVASVFSAVSTQRQGASVLNGVMEALAEDAAPITVKGGRIYWSDKLELPYSKVIHGLRLDISDRPLKADELEGAGAGRGVIICHDNVSAWAGDAGSVRMNQQVVLDKRMLSLLYEHGNGHGGSVYDGSYLRQIGRASSLFMLPFAAVLEFFMYFWNVFLCIVIFMVSMLFFRRRDRHSFKDILVLGVNTAVAPSLAAVIWYGAGPASWHFETVFCVVFVLYLLYLFRDTRKFLSQQ